MRWTIGRYPDLEGPIRALAERHRELKDEPLHLALAYDPGRDTQDVFVFELLSHFGADEVNPDGELFEVTFDRTRDFPLSEGQRLHLVLTSPSELEAALQQGWPSVKVIQMAVAKGDFEILFSDARGDETIRQLQTGTSR